MRDRAIADVNVSGTWQTVANATIKLEQLGSTLTGEFTIDRKDSDEIVTGALAGTVNGSQVAFTVRWHEFHAITSWVGELVAGSNPPELRTAWQRTSGEAADRNWASITAGTDTFTKRP